MLYAHETSKLYGPYHIKIKLLNSDFEVQLSSKITENSQETIRDAATF